MKKARIYFNMHTIPLIGTLGARRLLRKLRRKINPYFCQLVIVLAIGAM